MQEYVVKIRDYEQDITHTINQLAHSKNEANAIVMKVLVEMLGHDNLEVV